MDFTREDATFPILVGWNEVESNLHIYGYLMAISGVDGIVLSKNIEGDYCFYIRRLVSLTPYIK